MNGDQRIDVVGVTDGGAASLAPGILALVERAELLCGGKRQLAFFPNHLARHLAIEGDLEALARRLCQEASAGTRVVVLASGDPLLYGIGGTLRRWLPASSFRFHPTTSAAQLAWARIGEPWQDARTVSAHGRDLAPVVSAALAGGRLAILTDDEHTPGAIAQALLAAGGADRRAAVCERLGGDHERVVDTRLAELPGRHFDPLNVLLLLEPEPGAAPGGQAGAGSAAGGSGSAAAGVAPGAWAPGLPEAAFARAPGRPGLITKREVRVLSLAALGLTSRTGIVWDIGAGTGSVAIEAARLAPQAQVIAIERDPECVALIHENAARFGVTNLTVIEGSAPEACAGLPRPDAVFIGGSGGSGGSRGGSAEGASGESGGGRTTSGGGGALQAIVAEVSRRLPANGRLVINLATIEGLHFALAGLRAAGYTPEVTQVAVSRGADVGGLTRLRALNPVFIVAANGVGDRTVTG